MCRGRDQERAGRKDLRLYDSGRSTRSRGRRRRQAKRGEERQEKGDQHSREEEDCEEEEKISSQRKKLDFVGIVPGEAWQGK